MQITTRLSVEGPDAEGEYTLTLRAPEYPISHAITRAEADALIAALNPWRPIASAPKDGREILVHDSGAVMIAWWDEMKSAWIDNGPMEPPPQHWMPLPAPPSPDAGQATDGGER